MHHHAFIQAWPLFLVLGIACDSRNGTGRSEDIIDRMRRIDALPGAVPAQATRQLASDGVSIEIPLDALYDSEVATTLTVGPGARISVEPSGEFRRPVTVHLSKAIYAFGPDAFVALIDGESSHSLGPLRQDADSYSFDTMGFSNLEVIDHYRGAAAPGSWYAGQASGVEQELDGSRVESTYFGCFTDVGGMLGSIGGVYQPRCVDSGSCYQLRRNANEGRLVSAEMATRLYTLRDLVHSTFGLDWEISLNGAWDSSGLRYRSEASPHYQGSAVDLAVCRRVGATCQTDPSRAAQLAPLVASAFADASLSGGNPDYYVTYQSFYQQNSVGDHVHASVDSPSVSDCVRQGAGACGGCLPSQLCDQTGGAPVCRDRCDFNSDCTSNCCVQSNAGGFCAPDDRCGTPESSCGTCDAGQACLKIGGMPASCGARCNSNSECPDGCCVRTGVNGICASAVSCAAADTCGICDSGSTCVDTDSGSNCLNDCQSDSQCTSGTCAELVGGGSVCTPTQAPVSPASPPAPAPDSDPPAMTSPPGPAQPPDDGDLPPCEDGSPLESALCPDSPAPVYPVDCFERWRAAEMGPYPEPPGCTVSPYVETEWCCSAPLGN